MAHYRIVVFHQSTLNPVCLLQELDCLDGCEFRLVNRYQFASLALFSSNEKYDGYYGVKTGLITKDLIAFKLPLDYRRFATMYFCSLLTSEIQSAQEEGLSASVFDIHV